MLVQVLRLMLVLMLMLMLGMFNHQSIVQVALLRGGWNELMIAGFSHRSTGIPNGEIIIMFEHSSSGSNFSFLNFSTKIVNLSTKMCNCYKLPTLGCSVAKSEML